MIEPYLADLQPGAKARLTVHISERKRDVARNGAPFAVLTVADCSTRLTARKWDLTEAEWGIICGASYVIVTGGVKEPRNAKSPDALEFIIDTLAEAHDVRPEDFLPRPGCNLKPYQDRFKALVRSVTHPHLAALLRALFQDEAFRREYCRAPAAQRRHHAYRGGLLVHSVEVAELALAVCERLQGLDRDLLVTGALLHDAGKIREMQCDSPGYEFTEDGGLLGHVMLGADIIRETVAGLPGFPDETRNRLIHLVLSHHGRREWGAPVEPATAEALLLHSCDHISVQMHYCREGRRASPDLFVWNPALERYLYTPVPETDAAAESPASFEDFSDNPFTDDIFAPDRTPELRIVAGGLGNADSLPEMMALPIYGAIAAGSAIRSEQNLEGFRAMAVTARADADDFLLRVTGDSMRDAHILDGDLVRVRPHAEPREGEIIAALVNGDVTVKRYTRTQDGVILRAANPAHADIPVGESDTFTIQGRVVGLVRDSIA